MQRVCNSQLVVAATLILSAFFGCTFAAHAQVPDFDLETHLRVKEFANKSFTISDSGAQYVSADMVIDKFVRVFPNVRGNSQRRGRFTFDRLHLSDCLFFDFDAPLIRWPINPYFKPLSQPPPPSSCAQIEKMLEKRSRANLYINSPTTLNPILTIIIRHLTCEPGKRLYVDASGSVYLKTRPEGTKQLLTGAQGHVRYLINESVASSDCFRIIGDEPQAAQRPRENTSYTNLARSPTLKSSEIEAKSYTTVFALHRISTEIEPAIARNDLITLAALFKRARVLADLPVVPGHLVRRNEIHRQINDAHARVLEKLAVSQLEIAQPHGPSIIADVVYDLDQLNVRVLPTQLQVVANVDAEGTSYLGILEFDPTQAEQIKLWVETDFAIDPYLEHQVKLKLQSQGLEYRGLVTDWSPENLTMDIIGTGQRLPLLSPKADGSGAFVEFHLKDPVPNTLILALSNKNGVPVSFDFNQGAAGKQTRTVSFSLAQQSGLPFQRVGSHYKNESPLVQNIKYKADQDGVTPLDKTVSVAPGESYALADANEFLPNGGAYSEPFGSDQFLDLFLLKTQNATITSVRVQNLLGYNDALDASLDHVEFTISLMRGDETITTRGPFRLSPLTADGSETSIWFIDTAGGDVSFLVLGKAIYADGSELELAPVRSTSNIIKISEASLQATE